MINWLLCTFIGHNLTHVKTVWVGLQLTRVYVCKRCGNEIDRKAKH